MLETKLIGSQQSLNIQKAEKEAMIAEREALIKEREALIAEREQYETANGALKLLIDGLVVCESNLKKTYEKINEGIVCDDAVFSNGINKISIYNSKITSDRLELEELSQQLDLEIDRVTKRINVINSKI